MNSIYSSQVRILLLLLISFSISAHGLAQYHPDRLFIRFNDPLTDEQAFENLPISEAQYSDLNSILEESGVKKLDDAFRTQSPYLDQIYLAKFASGADLVNCIRQLSKLSFVDYAEKVPQYEMHHTPDDLQPFHWHFFKVNAETAWDISTGIDSIIMAVIDDGMDLGHEDLSAHLWVNPGEIPGNNIDDDQNGWVDDVNGYDSGDDDGNPDIPHSGFSHGTHVGGIMSSVTNNGKGVPSLAYKSKLMVCKSKRDNNTTTLLDNTIGGMDYAVANGARVANLSFGGSGISASVQALIIEGLNRKMVWVASAGNNGNDVMQYPAGYAGVIAVGSTSSTDSKSGFSSYGDFVDIMAPGSGIYSSMPGNSYANQSGTSMSSPFAASLAALILSVNPYMTPAAVEDVLKMGCDNIDAQNAAFVGQIGAGRINAAKSMGLTPLPAAPVANFELENDSSCGAEVHFIDLSDNFPQNWAWDFGDGGTSNLQHPAHDFLTGGLHTVSLIISNPLGSDTITQEVDIFEIPLPPVNVSSDTGACLGGEILLSASTPGAQSYSWSPSSGLDATDIPNPTVSVISTVEYIVNVMGTNGCLGKDTILVEMFPYPNIYAGPDQDIISNSGFAQLNATGASTYLWSPTTGLSCSDCADPIADPDSTTEYTVTGISDKGCSRDDKIVVLVDIVSKDYLHISSGESLKVYPNPLKTNTPIQVNIPKAGEWKMEVLDLNGRQITRSVIDYQNNQQETQAILLPELPSGYYLLKLSSKSSVYSQKIKID